MASYKQVETAAIAMTVVPLVIYLLAGVLAGPQLHLFHLSNARWDQLFTVVKWLMVLSLGTGLGAWLTMRRGDY